MIVPTTTPLPCDKEMDTPPPRFTPATAHTGGADLLSPRTPDEVLIGAVWAEWLGVRAWDVRDDFFRLGGDSLTALAVLVEVEKRTGCKLAPETWLTAPTIERLAALLTAPPVVPESPWVELQPRGTRPRLFLVHGVGGGMLWGYANLARHLGADQPVYVFKACTVERLATMNTLELVAAHYVRELRRFQPQGPYALGGYCFGGNVAYEMARQLEAAGERVGLLALLNASPPNSSYDRMEWSLLHAGRFARNLGYWVEGFAQWSRAKRGRFLRWKLDSVRRKLTGWLRCARPRAGEVAVDEMIDLGAVPPGQRALWAAHVRVLTDHRPQAYAGAVTLLRTRGHPFNCSFDACCGWGDVVRGGVTVRVVPGLHESLLEEPHVGAVARELKAQLELFQFTTTTQS